MQPGCSTAVLLPGFRISLILLPFISGQRDLDLGPDDAIFSVSEVHRCSL